MYIVLAAFLNSIYTLHIEERTTEYMNGIYAEIVVERRGEATAKLKELSSLQCPTYVPGQMQAFLTAMLNDKLHKKLAGAVDALEACLRRVKADSDDMDVDKVSILHEFEHAESQARHGLTLCCLTTATRILCSKAASNGAAALKGSIDAVLDFAKTAKLTLPEDIIQQLSSAQRKLVASASTVSTKKPSTTNS